MNFIEDCSAEKNFKAEAAISDSSIIFLRDCKFKLSFHSKYQRLGVSGNGAGAVGVAGISVA